MLVRTNTIDLDPQTDFGPSALPTPALIAHIIVAHHDYLRTCLPHLATLAGRVAASSDGPPCIAELERSIGALVDSLLAHLEDEENMVFPCLLELHRERAPLADSLREMAADHTEVFQHIAEIRETLAACEPRDVPCDALTRLIEQFECLERDMLRHAYLESVVLLPRFATA